MLAMKFGGTSMGTAQSIKGQVAKIIESYSKKNQLIVVVSAMSGVTNMLLKAAQHAQNNEADKTQSVLEEIRKKHHDAIGDMIKDAHFSQDAISYIDAKIDGMIHFMDAVGDSGQLSPKDHDVIIAIGEKMSAKMLSAVLNDMGLKSSYANLSKAIPTDANYDSNEHWDKVEKIFKEFLKDHTKDGNIPVATGYFGPNPNGILNAVGRGYSDFCAALCGAAMKVKEILIWTDVDGILSANPKIIKEAKTLNRVSFDEAAEMSHYGAKVLHPQSIRPALNAEIPIRILNTFNPTAKGTVISEKTEITCYPFKSIAYKKDITLIQIRTLRMLLQHGFLARMFEIFARHEVSVNLITTAEASVSVTIETDGSDIQDLVRDLKEIGRIKVSTNKTIVSVIGEEMIGETYIVGELFDALSSNKVSIDMASADSSEINVSLVVDNSKAEKAIKLLHDVFLNKCK